MLQLPTEIVLTNGKRFDSSDFELTITEQGVYLLQHKSKNFGVSLIESSGIFFEVIYAELSGDFPLGDSRQPTYKSLRPFDLVS